MRVAGLSRDVQGIQRACHAWTMHMLPLPAWCTAHAQQSLLSPATAPLCRIVTQYTEDTVPCWFIIAVLVFSWPCHLTQSLSCPRCRVPQLEVVRDATKRTVLQGPLKESVTIGEVRRPTLCATAAIRFLGTFLDWNQRERQFSSGGWVALSGAEFPLPLLGYACACIAMQRCAHAPHRREATNEITMSCVYWKMAQSAPDGFDSFLEQAVFTLRMYQCTHLYFFYENT